MWAPANSRCPYCRHSNNKNQFSLPPCPKQSFPAIYVTSLCIVQCFHLCNCKLRLWSMIQFMNTTNINFVHYHQSFLGFHNQLKFNIASSCGNNRAHNEDTAFDPHASPSCSMRQGWGLCTVVSRPRQPLKILVARSQIVLYNEHVWCSQTSCYTSKQGHWRKKTLVIVFNLKPLHIFLLILICLPS